MPLPLATDEIYPAWKVSARPVRTRDDLPTAAAGRLRAIWSPEKSQPGAVRAERLVDRRAPPCAATVGGLGADGPGRPQSPAPGAPSNGGPVGHSSSRQSSRVSRTFHPSIQSGVRYRSACGRRGRFASSPGAVGVNRRRVQSLKSPACLGMAIPFAHQGSAVRREASVPEAGGPLNVGGAL